jgi:hypothetical protein
MDDIANRLQGQDLIGHTQNNNLDSEFASPFQSKSIFIHRQSRDEDIGDLLGRFYISNLSSKNPDFHTLHHQQSDVIAQCCEHRIEIAKDLVLRLPVVKVTEVFDQFHLNRYHEAIIHIPKKEETKIEPKQQNISDFL